MGHASKLKRSRKAAQRHNEQIIRRFFAGTTAFERTLLAATWHFAEGEPPKKSLTEALAIDIARHHISAIDGVPTTPTDTIAALKRIADAGVFTVAREGLDTVYTFTDRGAAFGAMMDKVAEDNARNVRQAEVEKMHDEANALAERAITDVPLSDGLVERMVALQQMIYERTKPSEPDLILAASILRLVDAGKMSADDPLARKAKEALLAAQTPTAAKEPS